MEALAGTHRSPMVLTRPPQNFLYYKNLYAVEGLRKAQPRMGWSDTAHRHLYRPN